MKGYWGGGGNEYNIVPEIKTVELWNEEVLGPRPQLNIRANM